MAYLIERASKVEKIPVTQRVVSLSGVADSPNRQADQTNIEIAHTLKEQKQALIDLLACFPATASWLLRAHQHCGFSENPDEDTTTHLKSDLSANLNTLKAHYFMLTSHAGDQTVATAAQLALSTALKNFPFSFEELVKLMDLMAYTFTLRGLSYSSQQPGHKNTVCKRLQSLDSPTRLQRTTISHFFEGIETDNTDLPTLFLPAKEMALLFPKLAEAEYVWLRSRQKLARANNKLVLFIANQYKACFLDFEDLVQEGQTGLLKAVDRFDPGLGFQFSTYAGYWVRQAISRAISRCERVVRIPCGQVASINKVYRAKEALANKTGMEPNAHQLAEHTGLSAAEINTILSISQPPLSLESTTEAEHSFSPIDFLEQQIFHHPLQGMAKNDLEQLLKTAIAGLTEREAQVLYWHFGLAGESEMTLQEIGAKLNLTRERIRQIQVAALGKIKVNFGQDLLCFL